MKWAISLVINKNEKIESRIVRIVEYLAKTIKYFEVEILEIDATGSLGGEYTEVKNRGNSLFVSKDELINLLKEDGQLIDFECKFFSENYFYSIIVSDGSIVDILGNFNRIPDKVTGLFAEDDSLFYW